MSERTAIVIFGATGDLAQRMLFPALYFLDADGMLPPGLMIVGFARSTYSDADFAMRIRDTLVARAGADFSEEVWRRFMPRLRYCSGNAEAPETFARLAEMLRDAKEIVHYLSTSPNFFAVTAHNLKQAGLAAPPARIAVEKPIGHDLKSWHDIEAALADAFSEDRIFRVDHYLGKETVQNLLALRFANTLFEPLWNKDSIEHVQITVAETIGVEQRWSYYDSYGALRDIVQNHLLQLLCLVAMEPPAHLDADSVRNEKVKVLRSLRPITEDDVEKLTVRGQYRKGVSEEGAVRGYSEEAGGGVSDTETFVALCSYIDNWRWAGVPFYLRTGKRMAVRSSQIVVQFRSVPHSIFSRNGLIANRLTIRLQPEEEISLTLMNKTPSLEYQGMQLQPLSLNLSLSDAFKSARRRIAYERLLVEALAGRSILFVRRDEIGAAWAWIDMIAEGWRRRNVRVLPYAAGSWGPSAAYALTERQGHSWCD